jgi:hypothetical protein
MGQSPLISDFKFEISDLKSSGGQGGQSDTDIEHIFILSLPSGVKGGFAPLKIKWAGGRDSIINLKFINHSSTIHEPFLL